MSRKLAKDFYEIQKEQWRKSIFLFSVLILFYFIFIGLIAFAFLASFGLIFAKPDFFSGALFTKFLLANFALSFVIAFFHLFDAQKFGAQFILKRLCAQTPDLSDIYHKKFVNVVDEIRIASGLPRVKTYILPTFAINSLALIEADKTPCVIATEGLLADSTRDELEAVAAHELAHIARGDSFYLTLVCSLANFFERLREALESEKEYASEGLPPGETQGGPPPLVNLAVTISVIVMRLLSTLISRERETLADAAAVEFGRNPVSLARAIYKAHIKNSFVGDFNLTYSPLFIVSPESLQERQESEGFLSKITSSHPPLMERIQMLAEMVDLKPEAIIEQVWETQKTREKAKIVLHSFEEKKMQASGIQAEPQEKAIPEENKVWLAFDPRGVWQGPYSLQELLSLPNFTSILQIKNIQENVEARAREFPQIRAALQRMAQKKPIDEAKKNRCPRCLLPLSDSFYEGVPIKFCSQCHGQLIDAAYIERIFARKEIGFSRDLVKKAEEFKKRFLHNPIKTQKIAAKTGPNLFCPNCGYRMMPRPFNYQYFIPVDKCLSCYKIWFDADELEILQILIEKPEKTE